MKGTFTGYTTRTFLDVSDTMILTNDLSGSASNRSQRQITWQSKVMSGLSFIQEIT